MSPSSKEGHPSSSGDTPSLSKGEHSQGDSQRSDDISIRQTAHTSELASDLPDFNESLDDEITNSSLLEDEKVTTDPQAGLSDSFVVESEDHGKRLDVLLALRYPLYSRVQLRNFITENKVSVDGKRTKVAYKVVAEQQIKVAFPPLTRERPVPEDIPLDILYEDEDIVVLNKQANLIVHPARGNWAGTLTNALSHHFQSLSTIGGNSRPGIVHRLDRDTSGVIVVAKNDTAHLALAKQFEERTVEKEYLAIVVNPPDRDRDWIDKPIGLHPGNRKKMAILEHSQGAKKAQTFYEVRHRYGNYAVVSALPKTGRTHQIRVHFAHLRSPILCDKLYAGHSQITRQKLWQHRHFPVPSAPFSEEKGKEVLLDRQALHACRLQFSHPSTGKRLEFLAPIAPDIQVVLDFLQSS
ncbi:MAG: RluA family pseudouridine synthase [Pirellulaceae bacterium]|nr:RluA family pseudouridine synthase [Pirellulaceae bacterium]